MNEYALKDHKYLREQKINEISNKYKNSTLIYYKQCKKGGYHQGEILACICIDDQCNQNELICSMCEEESHQGHSVIPLKVFLESLSRIKNDSFKYGTIKNNFIEQESDAIDQGQKEQFNNSFNDSKNQYNSNSRYQYDEFLEEIERQHQITLKYLFDYQNKIIQEFNDCISTANTFYTSIKSHLQNFQFVEKISIQNVFSQLVKKQSSNESTSFIQHYKDIEIANHRQQGEIHPQKNKDSNLGKSITELMKIIRFDESNGFKSYFKFDLNNIISICEAKQQKLITDNNFNGILSQIKLLTTNFNAIYGDIPQFYMKQSSNQNQTLSQFLKNLCFSDKLKGSSIQINQPTIALQTQNESSGQRFCLLQPILSQKIRQRWGLKIKNLVGWIGVGICILGVIKGFNYQFKYSKIGHGSYLLSGNGYTWSHSKSSQNSQNKSFHFVTGDSIYVEFDPIEKKIKFLKAKSYESYSLDFDFIQTDEIVPCVNLCSIGDEIELILDEKELSPLTF